MKTNRILASGKKATDWVIFEKRFELPDYDDPLGEPSRIRWRIIHTPFFGIYLHKWNKPDPRPTLHDHPWVFFSIILKGHYIQKVRKVKFHFDQAIIYLKKRGFFIGDNDLIASPLKEEKIKWFNFFPHGKFHTVTYVKKGTWSLMFVGKTHDSWGYIRKHGSEWCCEYVNYEVHPHSKEFLSALNTRKNNATI